MAFQIDTMGSSEVWIPRHHRISKAIHNLKDNFPQGRGDQSLLITLYWGIQDIDRSDVSTWDPDSLG